MAALNVPIHIEYDLSEQKIASITYARWTHSLFTTESSDIEESNSVKYAVASGHASATDRQSKSMLAP